MGSVGGTANPVGVTHINVCTLCTYMIEHMRELVVWGVWGVWGVWEVSGDGEARRK